MPLSLDDVVRASRAQVSSRLGTDTVILELDDGVYYGLDDVGSRVWELLKEPRAVRALRDAVLAEYDVDPERCAADLLGLLSEMAERGLVEVVGASAP
jgi:hypothetical protein